VGRQSFTSEKAIVRSDTCLREKHVKLLGRMGRTRHGDGDSGLGTSANPETDKADVEGEAFRHEDLSVMPLHRLYYLEPPGQALISDLLRITAPHDDLRRG
jgi:hypothetical protein